MRHFNGTGMQFWDRGNLRFYELIFTLQHSSYRIRGRRSVSREAWVSLWGARQAETQNGPPATKLPHQRPHLKRTPKRQWFTLGVPGGVTKSEFVSRLLCTEMPYDDYNNKVLQNNIRWNTSNAGKLQESVSSEQRRSQKLTNCECFLHEETSSSYRRHCTSITQRLEHSFSPKAI